MSDAHEHVTGAASRPVPDHTETLPARSSDSGQAPRAASTGGNDGAGHRIGDTPGLSDRASSAGLDLPTGDPERYTQLGEHARGGLGRIVRARDDSLGRIVAVKELLQSSDEAERRFVREAMITARLQHPGIVPVHEAGRWPSGDPYYVMKLISGRTLKERIQDRKSLEERLALLPNIIAVAEAVAYAHNEGVIHRDIKPANIVVGEFGETVVVDWGIAKDLRAQRAARADTGEVSSDSCDALATAGVLGTPAYMAPEQARGDDVDERADVYALGAVLYEVLAGEQPYSGQESGDILSRVLAGPPIPLDHRQPGVPVDLLAVVRKAMARDPAQRYARAKELAEDLKRFQTGQLVTAHQYSTLTRLQRFLARHRAPVAVAGVCMVVLAIAATLGVRRIVDERNVAERQRAAAERAREGTERRRVQLVLLQARTSLTRDPTAAIAWLKAYPSTGPELDQISEMTDEAQARGVARHVLGLGDWGTDVAFSPDGKTLATASKDGPVMLWDVETGAGRPLGDTGTANHVLAFSPDGALLAIGDHDGRLHLWNVAAGTRRELVGHHRMVEALRFSDDGRHLVSAGGDRTLRVYTREGDSVHVLEGKTAVSPGARFLIHDGKKESFLLDITTGARWPASAPEAAEIAALDDAATRLAYVVDGEVRLRRYGDGKAAPRGKLLSDDALGRHPGKLGVLKFSRSGRYLVTAGADTNIHVWDLDAGEHEVFRGHDDNIYNVVFDSTESMVVSAGDDGTARVWDLATGLSRTLRGHEDDVYQVAISPDDAWIATASLDSSARLWSTRFDDSQVLIGHGAPVGAAMFTDDGRLLSQDFAGQVRAWNLADGSTEVIADTGGSGFRLVRPQVSRDGRVLVSHGKEQVELWRDGQRQPLTGHEGRIWAIALEPSGRFVITGGRDGALVMHRFESGPAISFAREDAPPSLPVAGLALSRDANLLAVSRQGTLEVWDVTTGARLDVVSTANADMEALVAHGVAFSPDGARVLAWGGAGDAVVWTWASGALRPVSIDGHTIIDVAFSPSGDLLAIGLADRTVRVWDGDVDEELAVLTGHEDLIHKVAFSPDGRLLASASYDKTAALWDTATWERRVLRGHAGSVDGLAFSADGRQLVTASRDRTLRVWSTLPRDADEQAVRARLDALTTAAIGPDDRPQTPR